MDRTKRCGQRATKNKNDKDEAKGQGRMTKGSAKHPTLERADG
ncbi:hypothetical protein SAMN05877809_1226 [Rhodobacter sp. JA431]|nr:hypothetical protein [Rhodobacter sp. JA431]SOC22140.1 hypothetical protein SAMN05877809_1226 [Rhodobacter sp. JA431]